MKNKSPTVWFVVDSIMWILVFLPIMHYLYAACRGGQVTLLPSNVIFNMPNFVSDGNNDTLRGSCWEAAAQSGMLASYIGAVCEKAVLRA